MHGSFLRFFSLFPFLVLPFAPPADTQERGAPARPAELVLVNAKVWTVEADQPVAQAVAIRGQRIIKVGSYADLRPVIRSDYTRILDLKGKLVLPGFIDNHVHFASAGRLLLGLNLLDVNEAEPFRQRVAEAARRLPPGAWLTGGDWGAYAQWKQGSAGETTKTEAKEFLPDRKLVDAVTGDHPALISRFDQKVFLANTLALKAAGITRDTPNPEGGEIMRDASGEPTGLLRGEAAKLLQRVIPRPSKEQRLAEARRALEEARRWGVTTIHDNVADFDQMDLWRELEKNKELTVRVWARMWLSEWEKVRDYIRTYRLPPAKGGWGDQYIRLGGLKAWVDGIMGNSTALFFAPYANDPQNSGKLRDVMFPEGNLYRLIKEADLAGFTVTVHAIGDNANRILLDTYEQVFKENPARDRRFRVVHAQVVHPDDFARFGKLGLIAEVQPYHCIDDMRWMEERIGTRARNAYAFRRLRDGGAVLSFGTDWPGTQASYYPINPLLGIYAAVTRQTLTGQPEGGWFPEERISIEEAIRYYTLNNAYATFEENIKGSIKEGKLADLVVLDRDILTAPPRELLETQVVYTLFDGKIVYDRSQVR
ncbi:MAG TPA: amidohydrolase [Candidatus Xenobia bacterium]|nr:amidohydrolase [Candidatus Xenobia bacterium]